MTRREVVTRLAIGLTVTMLTYVVVEIWAHQRSAKVKLIVVGTVGIVALLLALITGRRTSEPKSGKGTTIGSGVDAAGYTLEKVRVASDGDSSVEIAGRVKTDGQYVVRDVDVRNKDSADGQA